MNESSTVPETRIRRFNEATVRGDGSFVLYWMTANRRLDWNFALQRAIDWSQELAKPLVIFEPLRVDYPWASDRFHRFVMDGMLDSSRRLEPSPIVYYPWVEPTAGEGREILRQLAGMAAVVVTDDSPMFFYPGMVAAAGGSLDVLLEGIDSVGLLPFRSTERDFPSAYSFRRFLQKELPPHLEAFPRSNPTADVSLARLTDGLTELVPGFRPASLEGLTDPAALSGLPIDHSVAALPLTGGADAARERLTRFVAELLPEYGEQRNHPDAEHTSGLSAYLHFGHISSHEVFATIAAEQMWTSARLANATSGARQGWWGMPASSEGFLDQLVTWRELGLNMCYHRIDYAEYSSLPDWALATLDAHRGDERPYLYSRAEFETAATHDQIWNAAQSQLVTEGRMHNYLRMLWGKKVLEWSPSPEDALDTMIELNNKYALDGRDANSYSGIFWVLGRYDRAWGPERPVFGKVRCMTSANTARKLRLKKYLRTHTPRHRQEATT